MFLLSFNTSVKIILLPDVSGLERMGVIQNTFQEDILFSFEFPVEQYIWLAKDKYGYNAEQALGMLFWHRHDLEKATADLANFTPFPDEWTTEDKVLFEQAFQFHGKSFHRIRQMVRDSVGQWRNSCLPFLRDSCVVLFTIQIIFLL